MILSSKQLEELENLTEGVDEFDDEANLSDDRQDLEEVVDGALAWRRGMIEKALLNIKKVNKKNLSSKDDLEIGQMVFDSLNNQYARVKEIKESGVLLAYVSGGEALLQGMAIQRDETAPEVPVTKEVAEAKPTKKKAASKKPEAKKEPARKKPVAKKAPAKKKPASKKPAAKKEPPKKRPASKKPAAKKAPAKKKPAAKKKTDPNSIIKKHYKKMTNKQLAAKTGLSEHTIRRKLGEWGLKRPGK